MSPLLSYTVALVLYMRLNGKPSGLGWKFPLQWALPSLFRAWPFLESVERAEPHFEAVYGSSLDAPFLFLPSKHLRVFYKINDHGPILCVLLCVFHCRRFHK